MQQWWSDLNSREKSLILGISFAAVLLIYLFAIWYPLHTKRVNLDRRIEANRVDLIWMRNASAEIVESKRAGGAIKPLEGTFLALIGNSAGKAGISGMLSKLDPEGARLARVTFTRVNYVDMMRWLVLLRNEYGVKVVNASIRKGGVAGAVDAQLTLEVPAA